MDNIQQFQSLINSKINLKLKLISYFLNVISAEKNFTSGGPEVQDCKTTKILILNQF